MTEPKRQTDPLLVLAPRPRPDADAETDAEPAAGDAAGDPGRRGRGEGRDRRLAAAPAWRRWLPWAALALVVLVAAWALLGAGGERSLTVERDDLTVATVRQAPFQEFASISGALVPRTSIFLDAVEGGQVEEVLVREGARVADGQPLLRLSNHDLQLRMLAADTQRIEQVNRLEDIRFRMERNALDLEQQLAEMDYQIERLERLTERRRRLVDEGVLAQEEFEEVRDELAYYRDNRRVTTETYQRERRRMERQVGQMQTSLERMDENAEVVEGILGGLVVRAPVAGRLTALDAEVGELATPGERLGRIDVLGDGFQVRAEIDEYYIGRVFEGQTAVSQELMGERWPLEVTRVYPQVEEGRFEVDLDFVDGAPEGLRRGQTVRARLELSDAEETTVLARGPFHQQTGGQWAYVLDGDRAVRRDLSLGRQNPDSFEVVGGLEPGERVIVSSYEPFGDAEALRIQ